MDNLDQPASGKFSDDVMMRALAMIIDGVILGVANAIISAVLSPIFYGAPPANPFAAVSEFWLYAVIEVLISCALFVGYFGYLEGKDGQASIGKRLLGFQVQTEDGGAPDLNRAVKHAVPFALCRLAYIVPILGWLAGLAGSIYILYTTYSDPENRGWHDRFAGCKVVRIKK